MKKVQSQSTSNPTSISQVAAEAALNGGRDCVLPMVEAFKERHDYVVKTLNEIPGFSCIPADGAFYAFPNVKGAMDKAGIDNDVDFAEKLLLEAGVALVPGSAFGSPGFIRDQHENSGRCPEPHQKSTQLSAFTTRFTHIKKPPAGGFFMSAVHLTPTLCVVALTGTVAFPRGAQERGKKLTSPFPP